MQNMDNYPENQLRVNHHMFPRKKRVLLRCSFSLCELRKAFHVEYLCRKRNLMDEVLTPGLDGRIFFFLAVVLACLRYWALAFFLIFLFSTYNILEFLMTHNTIELLKIYCMLWTNIWCTYNPWNRRELQIVVPLSVLAVKLKRMAKVYDEIS